MKFRDHGNNTKCIHAGEFEGDITGGAITPIYTSTANSFDKETGSIYYPRYLNIPTQTALAEKVASLEFAEDGIVFSSGMAAISTALFSLLKSGDHAVFTPALYGGVHFLITSEFEKAGIEFTFAASNKVEDIEKAVKNNTKIIYIETPSNPLLEIVDIKAVADMAKKKGVITVIDNTFASPINQNPYKLGIDVVVHSATKYLNGHSDLISGVVVSSSEIIKKLRPYAINHGATLNGQSCFLLDRGIKTLALRIKQHNSNALDLANFLENHCLVNKVYYPGLESHKDHEIAKKQMKGFGGMLSFELNCDKDTAKKIVSRLKLVKEVGSLGGIESTITFPAETSHAKMSAADRAKAGIKDTLVRVSVGIEDIDDLIKDFTHALAI